MKILGGEWTSVESTASAKSPFSTEETVAVSPLIWFTSAVDLVDLSRKSLDSGGWG